jgi:hypothetical protein
MRGEKVAHQFNENQQLLLQKVLDRMFQLSRSMHLGDGNEDYHLVALKNLAHWDHWTMFGEISAISALMYDDAKKER